MELRYPFLDEDVWDFCAKLPPPALVRGGQGKLLSRRVAARTRLWHHQRFGGGLCSL